MRAKPSRPGASPTPPEKFLERLFHGAQQGDSQALTGIVEMTYSRLLRFCLMLAHRPELAQDLVQDTYIKFVEKVKTIERAESVVSWLFRTAQNRYFDILKSSKNKPYLEIYGNEESLAPFVSRESLEYVTQVRATMSHLKAEDRIVLLLVDLEGYSSAEAGIIMGTSDVAVRSRLQRARQRFLSVFDDATNRTAGSSKK